MRYQDTLRKTPDRYPKRSRWVELSPWLMILIGIALTLISMAAGAAIAESLMLAWMPDKYL